VALDEGGGGTTGCTCRRIEPASGTTGGAAIANGEAAAKSNAVSRCFMMCTRRRQGRLEIGDSF
jgi:hypothetical protein